MKHKTPAKKIQKNKPLSLKKEKAVKAYLLENAKQSFYAEGIEFNNDAWNWYNRKSKSA